MKTKEHYVRAGDKVKTRIPAGKAFPKGAEGIVQSTDGEYVYVKLKVKGYKPLVECEYYRCELDLVKAASDAVFKRTQKAEAKKIIKIQQKSIKESKEIIQEMQKILK